METIEIYLNKLADGKSIYAEISAKTGAEIDNADVLSEYLLNNQAHFRLYISDENKENSTVSEVTGIFGKLCKDNCEFITDEFLNLIDEENHILAKAKPRCLVHRDGDLHPAVHVWIIREKDMGVYLLLQKRSAEKLINPGCYDVSSAGHVPQGEEFRISAVREVQEELGIELQEGNLEFLSLYRSSYNCGEVHDNEIRAVYLCKEKIDADNLVLQKSEVEGVAWAELDEILVSLDNNNFTNCISYDELMMIKKAVF
ncbi:MAG: NUDIX domain-containing protein [Ruminococcus flavefaciens]|nr:NUDIX domain-containing protein [Ruminococcus flavefaciens]MCM1230539.1 NUDIX domain-containing protein [Ruminococcus flavefaciens]